jgi:hypothetical protein
MTPLLRHHVGSLSLGDPASIQHGLTGDQQFFINYAQSWRGKVREAELRRQNCHQRTCADRIPCRRGAEPRCVVRRVSGEAWPEVVSRTGRPCARVVNAFSVRDHGAAG